jgi:hypothetical protein
MVAIAKIIFRSAIENGDVVPSRENWGQDDGSSQIVEKGAFIEIHSKSSWRNH